MAERPLLGQLIDALKCLPGVGPKSSQRMAFHLLEKDREGGRRLAEVLAKAIDRVGHCDLCRTLTESEFCRLCSNPKRDPSILCVVETPADVMAIEQAAGYRGLYFVLNGRLSPIDGIGPVEIGLNLLEQRLASGTVEEVILATNTTVEGEATAHYIGEMVRAHQLRATRIAYGIPLGGELGYVDGSTLSHAIAGRREI